MNCSLLGWFGVVWWSRFYGRTSYHERKGNHKIWLEISFPDDVDGVELDLGLNRNDLSCFLYCLPTYRSPGHFVFFHWWRRAKHVGDISSFFLQKEGEEIHTWICMIEEKKSIPKGVVAKYPARKKEPLLEVSCSWA